MPVAVLAPAGNFYIAPDHLGAPHLLTGPGVGGAVAWQWNHDPFGNGDPVGSFSYDLRFPGQYFDQATRLHYNYFRDYDPRTGRYIESDPIGLAGGINTYAYVGGNPLTRTDPHGLQEAVLPWDLPLPTEMAPPGSTTIDPVLPIPNTGSPQQCKPDNKPDDKCPQLIQEINSIAADLKGQYNNIIYNPLKLPPTGKMSVGGHQQKFREWQSRLRRLLNQAASQGCTGYDPDAWNWATVPTPSPGAS